MILGFMRKSLVYSSPAVLKAFRDWRQGLSDEDDPPPAIAAANMLRYEVMVKAMRRTSARATSGWMRAICCARPLRTLMSTPLLARWSPRKESRQSQAPRATRPPVRLERLGA